MADLVIKDGGMVWEFCPQNDAARRFLRNEGRAHKGWLWLGETLGVFHRDGAALAGLAKLMGLTVSGPGSNALPVAVVDEESASRPGDRVKVIARFATVQEAEEYVGSLPDRAKVERGGYGIDDDKDGM